MHSDFDFVEDEHGGRFVPAGGPLVELRQLLARGDIEAAAKHYEETAAAAREALLEEAATASFETKKAIAQLFRRARDFSAAGRVYLQAKLDTEAAAAFEQAGDFAAAAGCWERAGELIRAAAAAERSGKRDRAVELYRQAGAPERAAEALARAGRYLEAAREYQHLQNTHAEVEALRAGLSANPADLELASRLGELMLHHRHFEPAAQLLMETSRRAPAAKDSPRLLTLLAAALDGAGNAPTAAKVRARLAQLPKHEAPAVASAPPPSRPSPGADAYGFLKALPMFSELTLEDMKALYRVCTLQTYEAGQHLIELGQPGRGLLLIVEGQVEVYAGTEPGSRLLNTVGVGGHVGEISLVQDGPTSARVTARTRVKALFISRDAFHQYLYGSPTAALCIYRLFTHNLAERVRVLSAAK